MKTILFQCINLLIDGHKMRRCYRDNMAKIMSERYGKSADFWRNIDKKIVADWASYHADLNYSGDNGIADIHEGLFRVTRALFTISKIPKPSKSEITTLANELISIPCKNILLPDVLPVLEKYRAKNYVIGTFSYLLEKQISAITADMPHLEHIIGADTLNHYEQDVIYFRKLSTHLNASPDKIVIVATSPQSIAAATQSGMHTFSVRQSSTSLIEALAQLWQYSS